MWDRASKQLENNIATISDRIRRIETERQGDWGTRCGAIGQYDYHCQLGNFLNQELYPQLSVMQNRYSKFISDFPKPTYNPLPVPNFDNTMVCQACVQCVNQSGITAGGNINTSLSQVNNCTINLQKKLEEAKKQPVQPIQQVQPIQPVQPTQPITDQKNTNILIWLFLFVLIIAVALGVAYYALSDEDKTIDQNV